MISTDMLLCVQSLLIITVGWKVVNTIEKGIERMAMTQQDLDNTVDHLEATAAQLAKDEDAAAQVIQQAVNDILAKVPASVDLTAEVGRLTAVQSGLTALSTNLQTLATSIKNETTIPPAPSAPPTDG